MKALCFPPGSVVAVDVLETCCLAGSASLEVIVVISQLAESFGKKTAKDSWLWSLLVLTFFLWQHCSKITPCTER